MKTNEMNNNNALNDDQLDEVTGGVRPHVIPVGAVKPDIQPVGAVKPEILPVGAGNVGQWM